MQKRVQCNNCGCWYDYGMKCPKCYNQKQESLKKFTR